MARKVLKLFFVVYLYQAKVAVSVYTLGLPSEITTHLGSFHSRAEANLGMAQMKAQWLSTVMASDRIILDMYNVLCLSIEQ